MAQRWNSRLRTALIALGAVALASEGRPQSESPGIEVDLALVMAVDVSYSMDPEEQGLQRAGYAEAFRSREVQEAIRRGSIGRIAVTYIEWASVGDQRIVVPWTLLDTSESALAFANRIASKPLRRGHRTSISSALDFSSSVFGASGYAPSRQVIDISGDGPNNQGRPVESARDAAVDSGITINGLPIMLKEPGDFDIPDLDHYYRDCVIGGQGAFVIPARDKSHFQQAIKTKILLEVAGWEPEGKAAVAEPAQASSRANCLVGEMQWRERNGN